MNVVCIICSELFIPSDDVFHTPCGHIFHFVCLTQWLERSKSCPQCRDKTTQHKIHRIYFNFSNNDTIIEDTCSLQDKVDKLNFQLLLKQNDIKHYTEKCETLGKQNTELKKEVHKLEAELRSKKSAIDALKDQINYFKQQNMEIESRRQEIENLRKEVNTYKNIQTLLEASTEHVDEIVTGTCEPAALITYICVMKREMTVSLHKRKELRIKLRSLQQELIKITTERNLLSNEQVKRKKLEEELMICESEKIFLHNKMKEMERNMLAMKTSNLNSDEIDTLFTDSTPLNGCEGNEVKTGVNDVANEREGSGTKERHQATATATETNSPYLQVKSRGVFVLNHSTPKRTIGSSNPYILKKRARVEQTSERVRANVVTYDGFGGHSKHEQFPNPLGAKIKKRSDTKSKIDVKQRSLM